MSANRGTKPGKLWSLWDMLQSYLKIYQLALQLGESLAMARLGRGREVHDFEQEEYAKLIRMVEKVCGEYGLTFTQDMAARALDRPKPERLSDVASQLTHLDDSLKHEIGKEGIYRIPPDRKDYYGQDHLLGKKVAAAFPSCVHDIQKAGDCYALGLEDACVHHLMLVLERGLKALAARVGVIIPNAGWQEIINGVRGKLNNLTKGPEREFLEGVNSEFGFLKVAYRNHSEHAHDDPYDLAKALSILNHVRDFMKVLEKGGLSEQP